MTRRETLVAAIAFTAFLAAGPGAFSALHDAAGDREAFACHYENDGVHLSVAGLGNRTLVVATTPPNVARCAQTLDVVAADRDFIFDVNARGFTEIMCVAYDGDFNILSSEKRKIISGQPVKPFKPIQDNRNALA
jgi:hypothetical protein